MKPSYENIKEMLDGDLFGAAVDEDGNHVLLQAELLEDYRADDDKYTGPLEPSEWVYTATWESKRTDSRIWYVKHWYHEDGTVEETFEHEPLGA